MAPGGGGAGSVDCRSEPSLLSTQSAAVVKSLPDCVRSVSNCTEGPPPSVGVVHDRVVTPPGQLPKYLEFMRSGKSFRPGTKNPLLKEIPEPPRFSTLDEALADLQAAMDDFFAHFEKNPDATIVHPIFGTLGFGDMMHITGKHVSHHLTQFGLE